MIRELSLGGGMGTKEDNLRIGSEADLEISLGMRAKIRAHVLLRRARVNEVGFEIVNTDLESRYRLRRLLVDALTPPRAKARVERGAQGVETARQRCSFKMSELSRADRPSVIAKSLLWPHGKDPSQPRNVG